MRMHIIIIKIFESCALFTTINKYLYNLRRPAQDKERKQSISTVLFSVRLTRNILSGPIWVSPPIYMLSREVNLLKFLHSLVVTTLMDDIVIVQCSLITLVPLKFGLWKLIVVIGVVEFIVVLFIIVVLNLANLSLSLHFDEFGFCWSLT
jgi:hypothetical protein